MKNIIDEYEIIGKIDEEKNNTSNSLLNNGEFNNKPNDIVDKSSCELIKSNEYSNELLSGSSIFNISMNSKKNETDNIKIKEIEENTNENTKKKCLNDVLNGKIDKKEISDNYKLNYNNNDGSLNLNEQNDKNFNYEKIHNSEINESKLNTIKDNKIINDEIKKISGNNEETNDNVILKQELNKDTVNNNKDNLKITNNDKNNSKRHYKVLIHAPACWKGEKFNSTPFIFIYDKSINFFTYSESPLEIEKYIIDTSSDDFESRVLTIIFYDSLFACSTASLLMNNNKSELERLPKPLSVFYLPLSKLDLNNDSVKYRLALRTNSILCNINIKEAISLFNNSSKISGQNVNKFSLHFILKNNNYSYNDVYNYLNYQTKIYGVPRSNLSSCIQKHKFSHENLQNTKRIMLNSSKSQVNSFKNSTDHNQFISLDKLKNKWENYTHIKNPNNVLIKKNSKLETYDISNDNESFISRVKTEIPIKNKINFYKNNEEKFREHLLNNRLYNQSHEKGNDNSSNYGRGKPYMLIQNVKSANEFDIKDDVLPDDSASMIHTYDKESALSEKGKNIKEGSTLTSNFRVVNNMFSSVKQIMKKRYEIKDSINNKYEINKKEKTDDPSIKNLDNDINEEKSVCYSQIHNLKYFNTNNSVCSSYAKNDDNLILAIKEIKKWMEKIEDKVSNISCKESEINLNNLNNKDEKYNKILRFLIKNVKNHINYKNKDIYKNCYLNIRNLYLIKKNEKVKFENKLLLRNYGKLKTRYKNVLVSVCKKNFLLKYYAIKDKFHYNKRYENMMRHLQLEKNDLLSIIEEKKFEQENNLNINLMLSEELKKLQEEKESILNKNYHYKNEKDNMMNKYELLHNDYNILKEEIESLKKENENIKNENENIKKEKESLKKELGDTKAKYFNLTGILEGEEKMYSKKVEELEQKLNKVTNEKNTIINEIKDEIDKFTKILNEKNEENIRIKEKLKELKNIEEKYKNTQMNFDSLKKEFEKSFDEVQLILKEMIQKEKEYTKKYNNSIKTLEEEHKEKIEKMNDEKEILINENNYYKDLCKNQCNKIISFDDSLTTAEKLLEHVLSQYPQLFNEFRNNSRSNLLNKSFGKMHYENIHAVRDNIKLIRKSLSHFKMSCKNNSFNFKVYSDSKRYNRKISHLTMKSKRINSISRNFENDQKIRDINNVSFENEISESSLLNKRSISNNMNRKNSIISINTKKNIDVKKKLENNDALLHKNNLELNRCISVNRKNQMRLISENNNENDIDEIKNEINNQNSEMNELKNTKREYVDTEKCFKKDDENEYNNNNEKSNENVVNKSDYQNIYKENNVRNNTNENLNTDKNDEIDNNLSRDINELNNIDIVNMYENENYSNYVKNSENLITDIGTIEKNDINNCNNELNNEEIKSNSKDHVEKDTIINKNNKAETDQLDKNNFNEIISFIEKNVIKNSESLNNKFNENSNNNYNSVLKNNTNDFDNICNNIINEENKSSNKTSKILRKTNSSITSYKSLYNFKNTDRYKNVDNTIKAASDSSSIKNISNNSKLQNNKNNITTNIKKIYQKNVSNTTVGKTITNATKKNSSMIYQKTNETNLYNNEGTPRIYTTHYKCKNIDEFANIKKDDLKNSKYSKVSLIKKNLTPDKLRNKSNSTNKTIISKK
ncbi:conserved Plasmodium protein, unknown function [Plasmodium gallinaceum]|uniref:Uncharacterized protein n=1 Tax=Plasmodium gallinaceum TaxID=5849 RepID=A0A1J1GUD9_PLAGA|nr:conserved Plasmodium protein, unknown function [Plasmodium gallinaceum]CRG95859.1 conserved Plasmodium protein, unknown function [Plasmodium gallinaceum]